MNNNTTAAPLLKTVDLQKTFHQGGKILNVLHNIDMEVDTGDIIALVGQSGSGKSTLLQMIGLLDRPTAGKIYINGREAGALGDNERTELRRNFIGFIYQFHCLLPEFSALENVMIPQMIAGVRKGEARKKAKKALEDLGLGERLFHRPATLSGGEQQRVAIARALINSPKLILADEPTGNLDPRTSERVFNILLDQVRNAGIGAIIATHNMDIAERMDKILEIKNGRIVGY